MCQVITMCTCGNCRNSQIVFGGPGEHPMVCFGFIPEPCNREEVKKFIVVTQPHHTADDCPAFEARIK